MVDPSACSSTSGTSGGRSLLDHLATTLGAFWRRHQPPPPSQQHPKPDAVVDADAAGALLLARVSTIKASKSYIERQVAECIREQRQSKEDEDGPERRGVVVETPARVELCRCATKKRGEPLEAYVRRISSLALEVEEGGEADGDAEVAGTGDGPTLVSMGQDSRPLSPKELAAGLLAASKDVDV